MSETDDAAEPDIDMSVPEGLRELDLDALVGQPVAAAHDAIETAGGTVRAVTPGQAMTMDYRPNRVTIVVVDDVVSETLGIG